VTNPSGVEPEVELVLLLSAPVLRAEEVERARFLLGELLDWNRVMGMLVMHRTIGVAWQNLARHGLATAEVFRPDCVLPVVEISARGQELLAHEQAVLAGHLLTALQEAGVRGVVLKGLALAALAYRTLGMRLSQDLDLLVERSDLGRADEVLRGLGYVQGTWNVAAARPEPASRQEVMKHTVYSHETFPYVRGVPDSTVMDRHVVDLHFSIELNTALDSDDAVRRLLSRRRLLEPMPGVPLWSLSAEDMFVFVCVHFAREARLRTETEELVDLVLYKVVDLLALLDAGLDVARVARYTGELGMEREVYFALHHVRELYPEKAPELLIEELRPESTTYVDQVQDFASPAHKCQAAWRTWRSPVAKRFFDTRRILEITDDGVSATKRHGVTHEEPAR
jgi:predicted Zn-ribbon and HTH transcriptional regulator